jgi:hypothetical protein
VNSHYVGPNVRRFPRLDSKLDVLTAHVTALGRELGVVSASEEVFEEE